MSTTEYFLLVMVIVIPLIVATGVTLWTLEQALKRQKKNRNRADDLKTDLVPDQTSGSDQKPIGSSPGETLV